MCVIAHTWNLQYWRQSGLVLVNVHYPFYRYAYASQYIHLIFHHIKYCIQNLLYSLHLPDNKCGNREILCSLQTSSLQVPSEIESEEVLGRLYYNAIPLKWKKVKVRGV